MRRREFITLIAAAAWPLATRAQPGERMRRIGVIIGPSERDPEAQVRVGAFIQELQNAGWAIGRNLQVEYRWANADVERIGKFSKELVALQPDAILANTTPVTAALQRETQIIPIVFVIVSDPVGDGFVSSLSRPGGNITGFINFEGSMGGKWLELLREIAPSVTRVATMFNPDTAPGGGTYFLRSFEDAATIMGIAPVAISVRSPADIDRAIGELAPDGAGLVCLPDSFISTHRKRIISLVERKKLPTVYSRGVDAREGGLLGYGSDYPDLFRRSASYIDRILRGAKPESLPVQVPTRFELVINLKTAKALGVTVPPQLLARADEVIE